MIPRPRGNQSQWLEPGEPIFKKATFLEIIDHPMCTEHSSKDQPLLEMTDIHNSSKREITLRKMKNMPRRSRPLIGRNTAASRRYRNARAIETPLQSETRRALRRLRYSEARVAATQTMQVPVQRIQLWTHKSFSALKCYIISLHYLVHKFLLAEEGLARNLPLIKSIKRVAESYAFLKFCKVCRGSISHIHVRCNSTCVRSVVMKSNREFENRAAIIVALRAGRSPKEIVDFLKLPKTTIYRVKNQFDEADSNKEGIATRKKHSRRSDRVKGEEFVKNVKEKIDGNPGKSMRAIAKEMDVGSMTIVRTIHEDLGLKSYALRKGQLLTENMKNNRKGKAAALLNNLKHDSFGMLRFFSDEKNFDVDQKNINVLETVVKPWMDMVAAGRKYVLQQDSAPAHKAKKTQSWLTLNVPSHWGPDIWPPNSPDCNPLDYYVWGVVERDVNKAPHTTIQSVKKAVHTVMTQMDKVIVAKACASFRTRLETVVANNGNYIE
ncbi:hypothetical protein LAZ67_21001247 [Cordylochernes scorpioides]|uniref:Transposase n=1 Tax=Cordylochernes scorpioides TaxID=51811 RepID=A0ABY6LPS6_9ARAC|nr:hypothetical protein LAZ67_21001247 [Cordylochernes scorpioides]